MRAAPLRRRDCESALPARRDTVNSRSNRPRWGALVHAIARETTGAGGAVVDRIPATVVGHPRNQRHRIDGRSVAARRNDVAHRIVDLRRWAVAQRQWRYADI